MRFDAGEVFVVELDFGGGDGDGVGGAGPGASCASGAGGWVGTGGGGRCRRRGRAYSFASFEAEPYRAFIAPQRALNEDTLVSYSRPLPILPSTPTPTFTSTPTTRLKQNLAPPNTLYDPRTRAHPRRPRNISPKLRARSRDQCSSR